jgi:hypothetical protein
LSTCAAVAYRRFPVPTRQLADCQSAAAFHANVTYFGSGGHSAQIVGQLTGQSARKRQVKRYFFSS